MICSRIKFSAFPFLLLMVSLLLNACVPLSANSMALETSAVQATTLPPVFPSAIPKPTEMLLDGIWFDTGVPADVRQNFGRLTDGVAMDQASAAVVIAPIKQNMVQKPDYKYEQIFVLVAPFPTVMDAVESAEIEAAWQGKIGLKLGEETLYLSPLTRTALIALWGQPLGKRVQAVAAENLLSQVWKQQNSLAIIPFEMLEPRWKVMQVDGINVLDSSANLNGYPLKVTYGVYPRRLLSAADTRKLSSIPVSNRDSSRMTSLLLTGTTALVRNTALQMEEYGVTYPSLAIRDLLRAADITHISNEVPFYQKCPPAKPLRVEMRFCSAPSYFALLEDVGTDVVELTGNHVLDWGYEPFRYTLDLYKQKGMPFYGGGANAEEARKAILIENKGNKLAFIGCNVPGPEDVFAKKDLPGAAKCDLDWLAGEVKRLDETGYLPIVTFQHYEVEDYKPQSQQRVDFLRMAASGAALVSGSQAHAPQGMAFVGPVFVHYGLGNLFFDQMADFNRPAFIDRYTIYAGKVISVELITTMLENYAQPRLMTADERVQFLSKIFAASVWNTQGE